MTAGTGMGWLERWWEAWVHKNQLASVIHNCYKIIRKWICSGNSVCDWNHLNSHKVSIYLFSTPGGRPCNRSTDSHCSSWESGGNDQTLHADRRQHPAEEGHLRGSWLLWLPDPLHGWNLGWHPHCLLGDRCLHLCSYKVSDSSRFILYTFSNNCGLFINVYGSAMVINMVLYFLLVDTTFPHFLWVVEST